MYSAEPVSVAGHASSDHQILMRTSAIEELERAKPWNWASQTQQCRSGQNRISRSAATNEGDKGQLKLQVLKVGAGMVTTYLTHSDSS